YHVMIPANTDYASLNLAMAVQILSYELRMACLEQRPLSQLSELPQNVELPSMAEIEYFYQHLQDTLYTIGFIKENHAGAIMSRLRRLYGRTMLEKQELNILHGILTAAQRTQAK